MRTANETKTISRVVFAAILLDVLAFTAILPLFPRVIQQYDLRHAHDESSVYARMLAFVRKLLVAAHIDPNAAPHVAAASSVDAVLLAGVLGSLFSLMQCITSPFSGALAARFGRRPVFLMSLMLGACSMLLWVFAQDFGVFLLSRVLCGIAKANVPLSLAIVSDVSPPHLRPRAFASVGLFFSAGFIVGPRIAAYFVTHDLVALLIPKNIRNTLPLSHFSSPALAAFLLLLLETIFIAAFLPETAPGLVKNSFSKSSTNGSTTTVAFPLTTTNNNNPHYSNPEWRNSRLRLRRSRTNTRSSHDSTSSTEVTRRNTDIDSKPMPPILLIQFLFLFLFSGAEFILTFLTHDRFQFEPSQQATVLGVVGFTAVIIQLFYVRPYLGIAVPESKMAVIGMLSSAISSGLVGFISAREPLWRWLLFWVGIILHGSASGLVATPLAAMASKYYDPGKGMGKFRSAGQLGRTFGPICMCILYWILGYKLVYIFSSIAMLLAALICKFSFPPGIIPDRKIKRN